MVGSGQAKGCDLTEQLPQEDSSAGEVRSEDTISLLDIIAVVVRRKRFIVLFTLIVSALVVGYAYLCKYLPPTHPANKLADYFEPEVAVILQEASGSSGSLSSVLAQQGLGSVASLFGASSAGGQSAELAQYLLGSDLIKDKIADEFDFVGRFGITKNPRASARALVTAALKFTYDSAPGVLTISYRHTDKAFATDVLNRVVDILEQQFRTITLAKVANKRQDLEGRVAVAEQDMATAKQDLIDFSVRYGIVDLDQQATMLAQQMGSLNSERTAKELERNNLLKAGRGNDDPLVVRLQNDIEAINGLLQEMRQGYRVYTPVSSVPQVELPRVSREYLDLQFEVTLRQAFYTSLRQSLESTLLEEKDQTSLFQVLRRAEVPEIKAGPSRAKICVIAAVAAFFLALFFAFVAAYFDRVRQDPEESRKLSDIRRMLRIRKR